MQKSFLIPFIFALLLIPSCKSKESDAAIDDSTTATNTIEKIDYSSSPYIGLRSHYLASNGFSNNYVNLNFFFYPDGSGTFIYYKNEYGNETVESFYFTYRLYGEVNVYYIHVDDNKQGGSGFFTTDSTGQVFVCEGVHYSRYA